ncbi:PHB depolymerase family esterase [Chlorogloeopsis sp. ULAP01]|uniref:extracellular catalytic domain type 2 short-chain-length polyhydroxyalkanoate depolymerase n=1 Tax=Chlorogloeopsis sp. ULAP01 TaxID=3056483 RepID=UPI0025AB52E8|nr:PHB depolymerase family esterase [Chlorogloeopsis sp. ULAP01]MDM9380361.1 PHB depolymerase family esterase [Chlorogloeopsis sp. ULAP01]
MVNEVVTTFLQRLKAVLGVLVFVILTAMLGLTLVFVQPVSAQELRSLNIDRNNITVSGLSSGAYMAVQMHTAFSNRIQGAGVVAGGPFYCAQDTLTKALTTCMKPIPIAANPLKPPNGKELAAIAREFSNEGKTDPISNLRDDNVYLFSGTKDSIVYTSVMDATQKFYRALGVGNNHIKYIKNIPAGHGFITPDWGKQCSLSQSPFINDCDYDQAGEILKHLLGKLNPPTKTLSGQLIEFKQDKFVRNPRAHGMAQKGYIYIPQACADGEACRLHIALHGCEQSYEDIGDEYYAHTGYNQWADSNNIVVLYPQAHRIRLKNPKGCWDWWGYTNGDYAFKNSVQASAIMKMVDQLSSN